MSKRIIGLDIGDVRIGVAVSDSSRMIATPCDTVTRLGWGPDVRKILDICGRYETDELVSGLPYNMDGTEGFQADKVRKFCEQLQAAVSLIEGNRGKVDALVEKLLEKNHLNKEEIEEVLS